MKILALALSLVLVSPVSAGDWPVVPAGSPVVNEMAQPCGQVDGILYGYRLRVYDLDPKDDEAYIAEYVVFDGQTDGKKFLAIAGASISGKKEARVYLELPGRGVRDFSPEQLRSMYSHPCEILMQILNSPRT